MNTKSKRKARKITQKQKEAAAKNKVSKEVVKTITQKIDAKKEKPAVKRANASAKELESLVHRTELKELGEEFFVAQSYKDAKLHLNGKIYHGTITYYLETASGTDIVMKGIFNSVRQAKKEIDKKIEKKQYFIVTDGQKLKMSIIGAVYNFEAKQFYIFFSQNNFDEDITKNFDAEIKKAIFHLFDFPFLKEKKEFYINEWLVTLHPLQEAFDESLEENNKHALTHVGEIARKDNKIFTGKDLFIFTTAIDRVFSFIKGQICTPQFIVGYDKDNNTVWQTNFSRLNPTYFVPTIFFDECESYIPSFFPVLARKIESEEWYHALYEALAWYLLTVQRGTFMVGTIALAQIAFERLSYQLCVNEKQMISIEGFNKMEAADKLRILFSLLKIPLEVLEAETPETFKMASEKNWDIAKVLVESRNSIMHPKIQKRNEMLKIFPEVQKIGIVYLALCILAICGYEEKYYNYLSDKSENVPWNEHGKKLFSEKITKNSKAVREFEKKKEKEKKEKEKIKNKKWIKYGEEKAREEMQEAKKPTSKKF